MQRLRFLLVAVPSLLLACGGSDAGSAFEEPADTGTGASETGGAVDSSTVEPDSRVIEEDAPPTPEDTGTVADDTAPPPVDSGVIAVDTGVIATDTGVIATDTGVVTCTEPGSKTYGGHCYFPTSITRYWPNARDLCASLKAHLVTITSSGEQAVVESISSGDRWIGLARFDGSPGFRWLNAEPVTYTRWASGEPNGSGYCARLRADGTWADYSCSTNLIGICERE
jgi:hypothetical protein